MLERNDSLRRKELSHVSAVFLESAEYQTTLFPLIWSLHVISEHNSNLSFCAVIKEIEFIWIDNISFHVQIVLMAKGQTALLRAVFLDAATESICFVACES